MDVTIPKAIQTTESNAMPSPVSAGAEYSVPPLAPPSVSRGLRRWIGAHKIETLAVVGIMLDWAPSFLFPDVRAISGTRLVLLPALILDLVVNRRWYLTPSLGWLFGVGFGFGVGGSYLTGGVPLTRLISLLPNVFVFTFFLRPRPLRDVERIVLLQFLLSVSVPVILVLCQLGIITPPRVLETQDYTRIEGPTNWSSLGLYMAFVPAALGGLAFSPFSAVRHNLLKVLVAAAVILVGAYGTLAAAQRSTGFLFFLCLGLAVMFYMRHLSPTKLVGLGILMFIGLTTVYEFQHRVFPVYRSFMYRMTNYNEKQDLDHRLGMYRVFFDDLNHDPQLVGPWEREFYNKTGNMCHLVVGESYYSGGLVFMFVFVLCFFGGCCRVALRVLSDHSAVTAVLFTLAMGFMVQGSFHPALQLRILAMMMGLWLSVGVWEKRRKQRMGRYAQG